MKKCYLIFLSLLLICCKQDKEFIFHDYESYVDHAEALILEDEYEDALFYYDKGYSINNNYAVGIDCYNAMLSSMYSDNFDAFKFWAFKLANKGMTIDFFESEIFDKIKNRENWKSFIGNFSIQRDSFLLGYDEKLKKSLESLVNEDQKQYCKLRYNSNTELLNEAFNQTFQIDIEVKKLIDKYGHFTEEKIGVNIVNDTILVRTPIFLPLIRHNFQSDGDPFFKNFVNDMAESGLLKKRVIDIFEHTPMSSNIYLIDGKYYIDNLINKSQKFTEDNIKKIKYQEKNKHLKFLIFAHYSQLSFDLKTEEEMFLKGLIEIDL